MLIITRGSGDVELESMGLEGRVESTLDDMELEDVSDLMREECSDTI